MKRAPGVSVVLVAWVAAAALAVAPPGPDRLAQAPNTWVKRSPFKGGPPSPGMGYEASLVYDPVARRVLRWGGHNQGGGGEQNAELWLYDPRTAAWELRQPNTSPPGVCCAQQNVFDTDRGRFLRFAAFSGNHGWQWFREIYLGNSSVWDYDLPGNAWRDRRPLPAPVTGPLRCASWDRHHGVAVVFGGEGAADGTLIYDPHTNTWERLRPRGGPAPRSGGNLAYDAARRLHVLFGSQFSDDPHTWAYDLPRNEWRDLRPRRQPPTRLNDAVLAYDEANRVVVAVVRVADKFEKNEVRQGHLETWAFDAGTNTWSPARPPREPDGWRNRRRILVYVPDQNVFVLENYVTSTDRVPGVDREQQVWTYRYAEPAPDRSLQPPAEVRVVTTAAGATVRWRPSPSAGTAGYAVYRGEGPQPWRADFRRVARLGKAEREFRDSALTRGAVYAYRVRAVDAAGRERADGPLARAQPRVVEDGVVSVLGPREVRLSWRAPPGEDIVGYHVERAVVEVYSEDQIKRLKADTAPLPEPSVGAVKAVGPFTRLTRAPHKGTTFRDTDLDLGRPRAVEGAAAEVRRLRPDQLDAKGKPYRHAVYAYRVRAVNALGTEGGPSPYWLTIPSAPQHLFAREEGERCHLKWAANPEQGLKGYRVYRMEGPRRNGPGQPVTRLTAAVAQTRFTDAKAGKGTRRYWVVAVDALGQEGAPSAPAWHERQYRRYYAPFVGEWHQ
jgi:hypothetical protein